jgi:hypothetical protein
VSRSCGTRRTNRPSDGSTFRRRVQIHEERQVDGWRSIIHILEVEEYGITRLSWVVTEQDVIPAKIPMAQQSQRLFWLH